MRKSKKHEQTEGEAFAAKLWRFGLIPRERLIPSKWIAKNFRFGPGREQPDFVRFPWIVEPADSIADYRIEESLFIGPPQIGKSLLDEGTICFFIGEDPGDIVAYTWTIPLAKMWSEQRVMPSIKACLGLVGILPTDPKAFRTLEILLGHMVIEVSPANETSTQSKTRRIVICDERSLWDAGRYVNAKSRSASPNYDGRRKIISTSNSGIYESDVEIQWRSSDQRIIIADCPDCGKCAPFKFSEKKCRRCPPAIKGFTIAWDENEKTRVNGVWNIDEVVKTVRLVCPHCEARFEETHKNRVKFRRTMRYIPMNPSASIKTRAWAVSGVAVYPWPDLVKQFLNASASLDLGDDEDMKQFILKGLNEPWSDDVIFDVSTNSTGDYQMTEEPWIEATCAAMTIDVQELAPYFWFVIRDWSDDGRSRLRKCGYAHTWDQLREIQQKHGIPDRMTLCDVTYNPTEVLERCAQWGWLALRGRDEDSFVHSKGLASPIRRYFSEPRVVDTAIGTDEQGNPLRRRAVEIMWSNTPCKDILARLYGGKAVYFGIGSDVPQFYLTQMTAERKQVVETRGTQEVRRWIKIGKRPNHLWDCEAMQVVFGLIKGPLRRATPPPEEPPPNS